MDDSQVCVAHCFSLFCLSLSSSPSLAAPLVESCGMSVVADGASTSSQPYQQLKETSEEIDTAAQSVALSPVSSSSLTVTRASASKVDESEQHPSSDCQSEMHHADLDRLDRASATTLRDEGRQGFNLRTSLFNLIPLTSWLPSYSIQKQLLGDVLAGVTVGLMVIPQGLGYASVALVPKVYGLYSAFISTFVYAVLGGCKDVSIGPTAILSLLSAQATGGDVLLAIEITFLMGLFQIALAILRLGILVDLISNPVLSGFTSAAAMQIILTQLGGLCGFKTRSEVYFAIYDFFAMIKQIHAADLILGLCSMTFLILLGKLRSRPHILFQQLATGRNALLVLVSALLSLTVAQVGGESSVPWKLVGHVPSGLPSMRSPLQATSQISGVMGNVMLSAFVGFLESIAIAKSFARQNNYLNKLNSNQELFSIGIANVLGSFFQSLPVTGSFSRTAVASQAGANTQLQGVFTGVVVLLALILLTPAFYYIPTTVLSSIVMVAAANLVDVSICKDLWNLGWLGRLDMFSLLLSFFACLFLDIQYGILIGVACSLAILGIQMARPRARVIEENALQQQAGMSGAESASMGWGNESERAGLLLTSASSASSTPAAMLTNPVIAVTNQDALPRSTSSALTRASLSPHSSPDWLLIWRVEGPLVFFNSSYISTLLLRAEIALFELVPARREGESTAMDTTASDHVGMVNEQGIDDVRVPLHSIIVSGGSPNGVVSNDAVRLHLPTNVGGIPTSPDPAFDPDNLRGLQIGSTRNHDNDGADDDELSSLGNNHENGASAAAARKIGGHAAITNPEPGVQGLAPSPPLPEPLLPLDETLAEAADEFLEAHPYAAPKSGGDAIGEEVAASAGSAIQLDSSRRSPHGSPSRSPESNVRRMLSNGNGVVEVSTSSMTNGEQWRLDSMASGSNMLPNGAGTSSITAGSRGRTSSEADTTVAAASSIDSAIRFGGLLSFGFDTENSNAIRMRKCRLRVLLLDCSMLSVIDTTAVRGIYQLCRDYASRVRPVTVHFAACQPHVANLLQQVREEQK